jgi:DNA-binding IscR family transcriptional regulator
MKLSEGVEAAIHCAASLAGLEEGATIPGSALAAQFGLSPSYLESVPGPAGGYRLARAAERISLLDIVMAVEGPQPAFRCGEIRRNGPVKLPEAAYVKPCGIKVAMLRAEKAWRTALAAEKLSTIVADFRKDADPRSVAAACAFVAQHGRPQKPV